LYYRNTLYVLHQTVRVNVHWRRLMNNVKEFRVKCKETNCLTSWPNDSYARSLL